MAAGAGVPTAVVELIAGRVGEIAMNDLRLGFERNSFQFIGIIAIDTYCNLYTSYENVCCMRRDYLQRIYGMVDHELDYEGRLIFGLQDDHNVYMSYRVSGSNMKSIKLTFSWL